MVVVEIDRVLPGVVRLVGILDFGVVWLFFGKIRVVEL
jgi:hypothetical protein